MPKVMKVHGLESDRLARFVPVHVEMLTDQWAAFISGEHESGWCVVHESGEVVLEDVYEHFRDSDSTASRIAFGGPMTRPCPTTTWACSTTAMVR